MELSILERKELKKSATNRMRAEGKIPAIIYSKGKAETIIVDNHDFEALLRELPKGRLATTLLTLNLNKSKKKVIVKEIQYDRTSYRIIHIDFEEVDLKHPIEVNVPIYILGEADCIGIKQGGTLRQVIRTLKVRCLPKNIPEEFTIDVAAMQVNEKKRLSDITLPKEVIPRQDLEEVVVVVGKR